MLGHEEKGGAVVSCRHHVGRLDDRERCRDPHPRCDVLAVRSERYICAERPATRHDRTVDPEARSRGERRRSVDPFTHPTIVGAGRSAHPAEVVPHRRNAHLGQRAEQLVDERVVHVPAVLRMGMRQHDRREGVVRNVVLRLEAKRSVVVMARHRQRLGGTDYRVHRQKRYLATVPEETPTDADAVSNEKRPIKMLHDRILVRMPSEESERRSSGGILIPATAQQQKRLVWGEVVGAGPNVRSAEEGDQVLFSPEDRHEVEVQGDDFLILRERDVHAIAAPRVEPGSTGLYL